MDKYILILTDTFEEVEALTQVDYLRRADIKVDMISITGKLQVTSNRGITVLADDLIENIDLKEYAGIIIPGGLPAAFDIRDDKRVLDIIKKFDEEHLQFVQDLQFLQRQVFYPEEIQLFIREWKTSCLMQMLKKMQFVSMTI